MFVRESRAIHDGHATFPQLGNMARTTVLRFHGTWQPREVRCPPACREVAVRWTAIRLRNKQGYLPGAFIRIPRDVAK